jgi:predicted O-methyltransferase YrrM
MIKARSTMKSLQGLVNLCKHIGNTKEMTLLEIGSFAGESTEVFAKHFKHVTCVDSWCVENADDVLRSDIHQAEKEFDKLCLKYSNITKIKGNSIDLARENKEHFDVIYIDGAHDYTNVKLDIVNWKPYIKRSIAGHDYRSNKFPGVIRAVNEILGKPEKVFCDFSWIKRIK